jgi:hypothetical protein
LYGQPVSASWASPVNGSWSKATAWSPATIPNNGSPAGTIYDVTIGVTGASYTTTLDTNVTIDSLSIISSDATVSVPSGRILNTSMITISAGTLSLGTGTIQNATISTASDSMLSYVFGSHLQNVRFASDQRINNDVSFYQALTLGNATVSLTGNSAEMDILNNAGTGQASSLSGNGQIVFNNSLVTNSPSINNENQTGTFTVASGVTIATGSSGGKLISSVSTGNMVNNGTVRASTSGATLTIFSPTFLNNGTLDVSAGTMSLGTISGTGLGNWTSTGTINISGGTLILSGTFSMATVGTVVRNGGYVGLNGVVTNTGQTLDLDQTPFGSVDFAGAAIFGGTLTTASARTVVIKNLSNADVLENVALATNLSIDPSASLVLEKAITLENTTITLSGKNSSLSGNQLTAVNGNGTIILDGSNTSVLSNQGSFTIGSGITVRTGAGGGTISSSFSSGTVNLNGTISAETPGQQLAVFNLVNNGTVQAINGATLSLNFPLTNHGVISATNSFIQATGTITTSDLNVMSRTNSPLQIVGILNNSNGTFDVDSISQMSLNGGTIIGGTIISTGSSSLSIGGTGTSTLSKVTLNTSVSVPSGAKLNISSSTLNASISLPTGGLLNIGSSTVNAPIDTTTGATLSVTNPTTNNSAISVEGGTLSLTSSLSNVGSVTLNSATLLVSSLNVVPNLTKSADTSTYFVGTRSNAGLTFDLGVTPLGPVGLGPNARVNGGSLTSSAGSIVVIGGSSGPVILDGTTVTTDITLGNSAASLESLDGLTLNNANVFLSSITTNSFVLSGAQTIGGSGTINIANGPFGSNTGTLTLGPNICTKVSGCNIGGTSLLINQGTITTNGRSLNLIMGSIQNNGTIDVGSGGSIRTNFLFPSEGMVTNIGTLIARDGGSFNATSSTFTTAFNNMGTVIARDGGLATFTLQATSNLQGSTLIGGTWAVYNNSTISMALSAIKTNNATILLSGSSSNFAAVNSLVTNLGTLELLSGRLFTSVGNLSNSGSIVVGANSGLKVNGSLNNTGTIDVGGCGVVGYTGTSPLPAISSQILSGYANGSWNGIGIDSTPAGSVAADMNNSHKTGVGFGEASTLGIVGAGTFAGLAVTDSTVVIRYTYLGDSNLDQTVNLLDLNAVATNFGQNGKVWTDGDSNYDGTVNIQDFNNLAENFGSSMPASGAAPELGALMPEPGVVGVASVSLILSRWRRRRG